MPIQVGDVTEFRKTVSECDVYSFAGITGDMHPNHVDESYMRAGPYGSRIAHGGLVLGLTSSTSTAMVARAGKGAVSYGYDKVRFIRPVYLGDTVTARYEIERIDEEAAKAYATVRVTNQHDDTVMVATHILFFNDGLTIARE